MKLICNIIVVLLTGLAQAQEDAVKNSKVDDLTAAYQREILFLSTYRSELHQKIKALKGSLGGKASKAQSQLQTLENQWLSLQTSNEVLINKLNQIERDYETLGESRDLIQATIQQAGIDNPKLKFEKDQPLIEQISKSFEFGIVHLKTLAEIRKQPGEFFSQKGEQRQGDIIKLGGVAQYGVLDGRIASLYPAGEGHFRVWKWLDDSALSLMKGQMPSELGLFLYENSNKEFVKDKQKTILGVINSGGLIGWIIVAMGFFALAVSTIRYWLLKKASPQNDKNLHQLIDLVQTGKIDEAQHHVTVNNHSVNRVLSRTLSFLKADPQKVDDAIMEAILKESQLIDRFGVVILVIASVAPLMGLLGTVTGMISTFDIITLYGTGNPKLLSGGISEALVTTMLGLIVAIPALLVGQFLSAKTEKVKTDMEKWALALCNAFDKQKGQN